ncbi:MAG: LysR family transcriptional regulator [Ktedonobacteraceae bacterium]|nr:LysR family transcriptional regulator [Ktedonobacteraceae bacterium]MBO0792911.1 LysR family transcriptional regulator [Ktedonobacteraceae bacterium]
MNLQNLRIFLKVAELEHITRASEELHLSQPAVTKIIQSLERETHLELVERQGRRIVLTHAGRTLQRYARRLFALEHEMDAALDALRDLEGGEVTFAANTTAWIYLLPPIVANFRARYPRVKLRIAILNSQEIIEELLNWNLDFGLIEGDFPELPEHLRLRVFAHDELVLVVSSSHRLATATSLDLAELQNNELLLREKGSTLREIVEQQFRQRHLHLHPLLTLADNEAIKQMVTHGVGATFISLLCVQRELERGELVQIPIDGLELRTPVSLLQRSDKHLSRAAQAFCSCLFDNS